MKRIGMICLALILALGALGVAYAPWTDEVEITQTVQTAGFAAGIRGEAALIQEKDVATVDVDHGDRRFEKDDVEYYDSVTIVIEDAYPCLTIVEWFYFALEPGSIPAHLSLELEILSDPDNLDPFVDIPYWELWTNGTPLAEGFNLTSLVNYVEGYQIHDCEVLVLVLHKHILQEDDDGNKCPMGATAEFKMTVTATQYNWP